MQLQSAQIYKWNVKCYVLCIANLFVCHGIRQKALFSIIIGSASIDSSNNTTFARTFSVACCSVGLAAFFWQMFTLFEPNKFFQLLVFYAPCTNEPVCGSDRTECDNSFVLILSQSGANKYCFSLYFSPPHIIISVHVSIRLCWKSKVRASFTCWFIIIWIILAFCSHAYSGFTTLTGIFMYLPDNSP